MTIEIRTKLQGFNLDNVAPNGPVLPFVHGSSGKNGQLILDAREITVTKCSILNRDLVYLFYGRPAYVPNSSAKASGQSSFMPFFFVVKPDEITIDTAYPFDSGAFLRDKYNGTIGSDIGLEQFEIPSNVDALRAFISRFYSSNKDYYLGNFNDNPKVERSDLIEDCYKNHVCNSDQSHVDDRSATIEIQVSESIKINSNNVLAVIMSAIYLNTRIENIVKETLDADLVCYNIHHGNPKEYAAIAKELFFRYLDDKGYF